VALRQTLKATPIRRKNVTMKLMHVFWIVATIASLYLGVVWLEQSRYSVLGLCPMASADVPGLLVFDHRNAQTFCVSLPRVRDKSFMPPSTQGNPKVES
jgi:hypothetical protein